jgi:Secretion system C-terminal sorting domain
MNMIQMRKLLTASLILIALHSVLHCQWVQTSDGINGGEVFALLVNEGVIYAGSGQIDYNGAGNVYRSTDNGLSWVASRVGDVTVRSLCIKNSILFAGTEHNGLYQSVDAGINWFKNPLKAENVWSLTTIGSNLIATGIYGTYISRNNGVNWITDTLFTARVLKTDQQKVYAGTGSGVYYSIDSGLTWIVLLNAGLPVEGLSITGNYINAGSYHGIYFSTNSGMNWYSPRINWTLIPALVAKDSIVITGTGGFGIWRSTNYGLSYTQSNITNMSAYSFAHKEDNFYAGFSGTGIFHSSNNGTQWTQTEFHNLRVKSLATHNGKFYAGLIYNGIYRSVNNGYNWTYNGLTYFDVYDFLPDGNNLFAATITDGLYYTSNSGINWIRSSLPSNDVFCITRGGDDLFGGTEYSGIFRSSNSGVNWISAGLNSYKVVSIACQNGYLFAGAEHVTSGYKGIKYSSNNGISWHNSGFINRKCLSLLSANNILFAGTDSSGILRSDDYGKTWRQLPVNDIDVNRLIDFNNYLICGTGRGVYYSSNSGNDWIYLNTALGSQRVYSLMVSGNYLFAGTESNAVWKTDISQIIGLIQISTEIPDYFKLFQNYPNPFNPVTKIEFSIPKAQYVKLTVYDLLGREVASLVNQELKPGVYSANFNGTNYPSGVYFYVITVGEFSESRKMLLVK